MTTYRTTIIKTNRTQRVADLSMDEIGAQLRTLSANNNRPEVVQQQGQVWCAFATGSVSSVLIVGATAKEIRESLRK